MKTRYSVFVAVRALSLSAVSESALRLLAQFDFDEGRGGCVVDLMKEYEP